MPIASTYNQKPTWSTSYLGLKLKPLIEQVWPYYKT